MEEGEITQDEDEAATGAPDQPSPVSTPTRPEDDEEDPAEWQNLLIPTQEDPTTEAPDTTPAIITPTPAANPLVLQSAPEPLRERSRSDPNRAHRQP